ncbi:LPS O-antigen chain length determinant protein WzzB [Vibrio fluvialis]|uniref:LPS O-antigen chain length determinant protein WzzB n=1 Tax=Vibrio fluvialis TaxID=676 RepID=UPI001C9C2134|nr:Wzz/FepE/Etk N-terminal domain-containing protein [Vibrio fluvialis]EKO3387382.1 LPS O-antigen chain length determinant protein WzzB [Vibrio fluvialis]ELD1800040.1 LPS O-antigen chain length determinant protein WzzB [Vibrio fluvialis]MBY7937211.1 LPS chain length-determining protein [Vibrio fluvialis]MCE7583155.1 Wzz/FepE/Etk N-terminal domain-containing protein [Vibrio fluvialis]UPO64970.1 chain-length determining protein [Vibrio fluvialis]
MNRQSLTQAPRYHLQDKNDEIDLRELFTSLWEGRVIIVLSILLFTVTAFIYAFTAQQWWNAKATISPPELNQIVTFQQQVKQYQPLFDLYQDDGTVIVSEELDELINPANIFQRFVRTFSANDNKKRFMQTSPTFLAIEKQLFQPSTSNNSDDARASFYQNWYDRIAAHVVDSQTLGNKKQVNDVRLSFQSIDKTSSLTLLREYVDFINSILNQQLASDLASKLTVKHNQLAQQYSSLEQQTKLRLKVELVRTQYALTIAKAANVSEPVQNLNEEKLFAISIGSKALQAKIEALKSMVDLSVFEPRLAMLKAQIQHLDILGKNNPAQVQSYSYVAQPEEPMSRDKPKRSLIVVLGMIIGALFGGVVVLLRFATRVRS